jgi:transposase
MAIINQHDKRSGLTYVYDSKSYWDKERKRPCAKRTLIGRRDLETGEIVPTDGRGRKRNSSQATTSNTPTVKITRKYFGATHLLDEIGKKLEIESILKSCFPENYKQILSIAYYLTLEDASPLYRFEKWDILHKHPFGADIPSQRSSELFSCITEDAKSRFLSLFAKKHAEKEHWYYDTTSFSSFSDTLKQVQYGKNKEHDKLPQYNLGLVYGQKSNLPFYYRKLAGNISDVSTIKKLVQDCEELGFKNLKFVLDRGFYSQTNINLLMKEHKKFLIALKTSYKIVRNELEKVYDTIESHENYSVQHDRYSITIPITWEYTEEHPYKKAKSKSNKRVYLHLYYNMDKAMEDKKIFHKYLNSLENEIVSGKSNPENAHIHAKYFDINKSKKGVITAKIKTDVVKDAMKFYGYFALLSNEKMTSIEALELYRNSDVIEKAFGNIKERLNLRRSLVSSEQSLDGKLFVAYIGLIYLSYIKKCMQETKLFDKYSIQTMFDKLDVIECFEFPGRKLQIGEVTEKQREIYRAFGIEMNT